MRLQIGITAALLAVLALALPSAASALELGKIEEFTGAKKPVNIAKGPDGNLWFTDVDAGKIGRITPSGTITEYSCPSCQVEFSPFAVAAGPDGKIWFTEPVTNTEPFTGKIGRIDPSNPEAGVEEFSTGLQSGSHPFFITAGPDGNLWFNDEGSIGGGKEKIGRITPSGTITEYESGLNAGSSPKQGIAGADGNVWFEDQGATPAVIRVEPGEEVKIKEFPLSGKPKGIALGPDGNVWMTAGTKLESVTPSGEVTSHSTSAAEGDLLYSLVSGSDGNLWAEERSEKNEVQELKLEATSGLGGLYKLSYEGKETGWTGKGNINGARGEGDVKRFPTSGEVKCTFKKESKEVTCPESFVESAKVGMRITCASCSSIVQFKTTIAATSGTTITMSLPGKAGVAEQVSKSTSIGWVENVGTKSGSFAVGQLLTSSSGSPSNSEIIAVGKNEEGKVVTVTTEAVPTVAGIKTGASLEAGSKTISGVSTTTGCPVKGEEVSGAGIPAGTTIASAPSGCEPTSLSISSFPTETATGVSLGADLPYSASSTMILEALEKLTPLTGNVSVAGSGTVSPVIRNITFVGEKERTNVPLIGCDGSKLTGTSPSCSVATIKESSPNKLLRFTIGGEVSTEFPFNPPQTNNGGAQTGTLALGPDGNLWVTGLGLTKAIDKFGLEYNTKLIVTCSGSGSGTVSSEPAGASCGSTAEFAAGKKVKLTAKAAEGSEFAGWTKSAGTCTGTTSPCEVTMNEDHEVTAEFNKEPGPTNKRTITLAKSPAGSAGEGLGSVSSKPKGVKCATTCNEAIGRFYKEQAVVLTAAPSGETSAFDKWVGCPEPVGLVCTIPADSNSYKVEAVFKGSSKAFSPAEPLTLSKGESEASFGYGTVKASGLTCESECDSTVVLYQGPILSPKFKAGKLVELKEAPAFGSKFVGWSGACSGTEPTCKVTMEEAKSVTAEFASVPNLALKVEKAYAGGLGSVSSKPKGINCGTTCTQTSANMPEGSSILLTAKVTTTEPATTFKEWVGGDCNGKTELTCAVGMNQAETIKAVFSGPVKTIVEAKSLTLSKEGSAFGTVKAAGLTCEVLCTGATSLYYGPVTSPKVKAGATVILKATPAPGSKAVEWTGCTPINATECKVTMETDKSVTAKFDELE